MKNQSISTSEYESIEKSANKLLFDLGYKDIDVVDVTALATRLGFLVGEIEAYDGLDGFIVLDDNGINSLNTSKLIGINKDLSFEEKRFTTAHELGHYILQAKKRKGKTLPFACREHRNRKMNKQERIEEDKMDYFAACILMPQKAVTNYFNQDKSFENKSIREKIKLIAKYFNVSTECALYRLEELNLI